MLVTVTVELGPPPFSACPSLLYLVKQTSEGHLPGDTWLHCIIGPCAPLVIGNGLPLSLVMPQWVQLPLHCSVLLAGRILLTLPPTDLHVQFLQMSLPEIEDPCDLPLP